MLKNKKLLLTVIGALAAFSPVSSWAVIYIDETFETDTIGVAPANSSQYTSSQVLTAAGTGSIGTDNVARFNDTSSTAGAALEYNVGASALGSMYIQFDLLNNAPVTTGTAANAFIFGVGSWSTATSTRLSSSANRAFGLEFSQTGGTNTLRLRVDATSVVVTTYSMLSLQNVQIWVNDHDANTLDYIRPDGFGTGTLGANSVVVYLNGALVGTETASGFTMNTSGSGTGNTTGDATIGRLGFNSTTTNLVDFLIDNVYITDVSAIPEPSTVALLMGAGLFWGRRFRQKKPTV
jgi:hypothetical protein